MRRVSSGTRVFGLILAPDLSQAPLHAPPFVSPQVQLVEEPVAHEGVDVDFAALRTAAAGLVFNECSSWGGRGGWSADVGDLLVSERSSDGVSWLPPARPLQVDTKRDPMVVEDVLLKSTVPQLLPAGASGGPPPLGWWPTQTNRQGDGGPLNPRVIEKEEESRSTDEEERLLMKC